MTVFKFENRSVALCIPKVAQCFLIKLAKSFNETKKFPSFHSFPALDIPIYKSGATAPNLAKFRLTSMISNIVHFVGHFSLGCCVPYQKHSNLFVDFSCSFLCEYRVPYCTRERKLIKPIDFMTTKGLLDISKFPIGQKLPIINSSRRHQLPHFPFAVIPVLHNCSNLTLSRKSKSHLDKSFPIRISYINFDLSLLTIRHNVLIDLQAAMSLKYVQRLARCFFLQQKYLQNKIHTGVNIQVMYY